jgi:hypothetical protein
VASSRAQSWRTFSLVESMSWPLISYPQIPNLRMQIRDRDNP